MYLQIHEELPEHPKSLALCDSLDEPLAWAYPIRLWMWCAKYAKDGDLSRFSPGQIERGAGWQGARGRLVDALVIAGFIDRSDDALSVHDWMHYTGADIVKMATDAERKRRGRLKNGAEDPKDIPAPSAGCPPDGARTAQVSNQSKADQSEAKQEVAPATPPPHPAAVKPRKPRAPKQPEPDLPGVTVTRAAFTAAIAAASGGRYVDTPPTRGAVFALDVPRARPDALELAARVGRWLAAGGDAWRGTLDGRHLADLPAWVGQAEAWDGKPIARPVNGATQGTLGRTDRGPAPVSTTFVGGRRL